MNMNRREFLAVASSAAVARGAAAKQPPSILLITVEDLGAWMLGIYGNKSIRTPQLDTQGRSGTRLMNACAAAPAPEPGRESLLRGVGPAQLGGTHPTLIDIFRSHGYIAAGSNAPAASLEQCTRSAVDFLNAQAPHRPFFFTVNYAPLRADSVPDRCAQLYADSNFSDLGWLPGPKDIIPSLRKAAAAVTYFDEQIPAVRDAIVRRNLYDSTMLIITGTCGQLLGRHGLWGDGRATNPPNMFEEVIRVPFLCSWPGQTPADAYRIEEVGGYDLVPTLCAITGVRGPGGLPGRNFSRVLLNEPFPKKDPWKNLVFAELNGTVMARDNRYKLVLHPDGTGELYDLPGDPAEGVNRFDDESYISVKTRLTNDVIGWRRLR